MPPAGCLRAAGLRAHGAVRSGLPKQRRKQQYSATLEQQQRFYDELRGPYAEQLLLSAQSVTEMQRKQLVAHQSIMQRTLDDSVSKLHSCFKFGAHTPETPPQPHQPPLSEQAPQQPPPQPSEQQLPHSPHLPQHAQPPPQPPQPPQPSPQPELQAAAQQHSLVDHEHALQEALRAQRQALEAQRTALHALQQEPQPQQHGRAQQAQALQAVLDAQMQAVHLQEEALHAWHALQGTDSCARTARVASPAAV
jgi:hypothetical protein